MCVEEQIRDTKGCRFGLRLKWTHFETPAYLARFCLLLGAALLMWTAAGAATLKWRPKAQMHCKSKGTRVSLVRIDMYFLGEVLTNHRFTARFLLDHLPPPNLRSFRWLETLEART